MTVYSHLMIPYGTQEQHNLYDWHFLYISVGWSLCLSLILFLSYYDQVKKSNCKLPQINTSIVSLTFSRSYVKSFFVVVVLPPLTGVFSDDLHCSNPPDIWPIYPSFCCVHYVSTLNFSRDVRLQLLRVCKSRRSLVSLQQRKRGYFCLL